MQLKLVNFDENNLLKPLKLVNINEEIFPTLPQLNLKHQ